MNKAIYKEPSFLKDIHQNQISHYNKTKRLTVSKRIFQVIKHARINMGKLGLRTVEFTKSARTARTLAEFTCYTGYLMLCYWQFDGR